MLIPCLRTEREVLSDTGLYFVGTAYIGLPCNRFVLPTAVEIDSFKELVNQMCFNTRGPVTSCDEKERKKKERLGETAELHT